MTQNFCNFQCHNHISQWAHGAISLKSMYSWRYWIYKQTLPWLWIVATGIAVAIVIVIAIVAGIKIVNYE